MINVIQSMLPTHIIRHANDAYTEAARLNNNISKRIIVGHYPMYYQALDIV